MTNETLSRLFSVLLLFGAVACGSSKAAPAAALTADDAGDDGATEMEAAPQPPCGPSTIAAGTFDFSFQSIAYSYIVHLPSGYDGTTRTPLVLNWHGFGSNAAQQEAFSGMDRVADAQNFIVVYPNSPSKSWNAGTCCGSNMEDDVAFARALVQQIEDVGCVDAKRIYSTGMSNGAFMSHRLGCEAANLFAAVAPVAGKVGTHDCQPSRPISVLAFHGTKDPLVSYDTSGLSYLGYTVPQDLQAWADRDGCTQGPDVTYQNGTVTCQTWSQCDGGVQVELCSADGEGHCWPGTPTCPYGAYTTDINASETMAAFFQQYSLP